MKKADFILIGVVVIVAAVMLIFLYGFGDSGSYVFVEIDGSVVKALPLDEDTQYVIETENGTNTLVIKDGEAMVTKADCPDGICVDHMPISRNGESIICLPHKVVITVDSEPSEDDVDAVA